MRHLLSLASAALLVGLVIPAAAQMSSKTGMKNTDKMICGQMCGMKQEGSKGRKSGMCPGCSGGTCSCSCCSDMQKMDGNKG